MLKCQHQHNEYILLITQIVYIIFCCCHFPFWSQFLFIHIFLVRVSRSFFFLPFSVVFLFFIYSYLKRLTGIGSFQIASRFHPIAYGFLYLSSQFNPYLRTQLRHIPDSNTHILCAVLLLLFVAFFTFCCSCPF